MTINIVEAKPTDVEKCIELIIEVGLIMPADKEYTIDRFKEYADDSLFMIAKKEEVIIGFILGEKMKCKGAMLWYIVVDPSFQGEGLGRKLIKTFEDRCKNAGVEWVVGYSDIAEETLRFYKNNNYDFGEKYVEIFKMV